MERTLPEYQPEASCPMCGHEKVGTQYQSAVHPRCDSECFDKRPEYLERRCERCRYSWEEATIEQQASRAAATGEQGDE